MSEISEKAIKLIKDLRRDISIDIMFTPEKNAEDDSLKALVDYIAELEAERRWIPVGERLPTEDGYYWALDIFKQEQKYKFVQGKWRDQSGMLVEYLATRVTHWMPLPNPPEVQE